MGLDLCRYPNLFWLRPLISSQNAQCQCNASGMTLLAESCPACGTPRCISCDIHKQAKWRDKQALCSRQYISQLYSHHHCPTQIPFCHSLRPQVVCLGVVLSYRNMNACPLAALRVLSHSHNTLRAVTWAFGTLIRLPSSGMLDLVVWMYLEEAELKSDAMSSRNMINEICFFHYWGIRGGWRPTWRFSVYLPLCYAADPEDLKGEYDRLDAL